MRIVLSHNQPTIQTPVKKNVLTNELPIVIKPTIIRNATKPTKQKTKIPLKIAQPTNTTFLIKPTTTIKNDKLHLLIDSLSDSFQELSKQLNQLKFDKDGIHLPRQHKLFFETVITSKKLQHYITINHFQEEEMLQSLNFTWHKAPIIKENDDIMCDSTENISGYELKLKFPSCLSLSNDQRLKEKPIREFLEQSKFLRKDEKIWIQFGIQPSEFEWYKEAESIQKNLPKRIKITEASKTKVTMNGFDCCLRVIVKSDTIERRSMIARGIIMSLKQLNGDNELMSQEIKYKELGKWINNYVIPRKMKVNFFRFKKRFILSRKEIQHFIKLPQRNLQKEFELDISERDELNIDKLLRHKNGILIGHAEDKGKKVDIRIPIGNLDSLMQTNIYVGSPRQGKDTAYVNSVIESVKTLNIGAIIPDVIDEKGNGRGMCDSIRDNLPPEKVIDLNLGDYNNPIYFGLEDVAELIGTNGMNVIADNFVRVLGLSETTDSQELCSLIAKACKCNIYKMYCCLKSKKYAKDIYEIIKKEDELLALEYKHEFLNAKRDKAVATVKTRLKLILGNPHFKHMMAQDENKDVDFEKWIRERKVVLLRMKKMDIGDIGVRILMYLISMKVFWIKKIIQTDDPTHIVYNEPHQFMSEGLQELTESMMAESPKYRLCINWIFHSPHQLPSKLYEIMRSSSCSWFLFKNTNWKLYHDLKEHLNPIEVETAMKTNKYESIYIPFVDSKQLEPLFVKMLPPPKDRMKSYENEYLSEYHSKKYGRNVEEVREKIKQIELSMYNEESA